MHASNTSNQCNPQHPFPSLPCFALPYPVLFALPCLTLPCSTSLPPLPLPLPLPPLPSPPYPPTECRRAYDALLPLRNTELARVPVSFSPLSSVNSRGAVTTMGKYILSLIKVGGSPLVADRSRH